MTRQNHKRGFNLTRSSSATVAHKTRKGFNLIEAAIVLAVVGGVIGGIWGAAAHFMEEYKVNKTANDIAIIVKNAQDLISFRDFGATGGSVDLTQLAINASIFNEDWINGNTAKNPFGGDVMLAVTDQYPPPYINLVLFDIPDSVCVKLAVNISNMAAMAGSRGTSGVWGRPNIGNISFGLPGQADFTDESNFPISMNTAKTKCQNRTTKRMGFNFGFTRNN